MLDQIDTKIDPIRVKLVVVVTTLVYLTCAGPTVDCESVTSQAVDLNQVEVQFKLVQLLVTLMQIKGFDSRGAPLDHSEGRYIGSFILTKF